MVFKICEGILGSSFYDKEFDFFVHISIFLVFSAANLIGPSGVSPNQHSRWKIAFSPLNHV